jgi:putative ABC transport system permease protein
MHDSAAQLVRLALRNVGRHRGRTAMTLLAVAAGVATLVLASGFVKDMFFQLGEALIHSQTGHLQVARKGFFSSGSRSPEQYLMELRASDLLAVQRLPQVADVLQRVRFSALLGNGRADLAVLAEGVEPDKETRLGTYLTITQGRALTDRDKRGILVGAGVAELLQLRPGAPVTLLVSTQQGALNTTDFEVVGVFRTFSKDFDARAARIGLDAAQDLTQSKGANSLVVSLRRTADTDRVAGALQNIFDHRFEVARWTQINDFYAKTVALYDRQLGVLQLIVLVMVALGVVNLVNMAVLERIGEFGTMRALGNQDAHVFALVLLENALVAVLGSALGLAAGAVLGEIISAVGIPMPPPPNADVGYIARIRPDAGVFLEAFLVGFLATIAAAIAPAIRVTRMPIATQLGHNA